MEALLGCSGGFEFRGWRNRNIPDRCVYIYIKVAKVHVLYIYIPCMLQRCLICCMILFGKDHYITCIDTVPTSSKGCCLNPREWYIGTPYLYSAAPLGRSRYAWCVFSANKSEVVSTKSPPQPKMLPHGNQSAYCNFFSSSSSSSWLLLLLFFFFFFFLLLLFLFLFLF